MRDGSEARGSFDREVCLLELRLLVRKLTRWDDLLDDSVWLPMSRRGISIEIVGFLAKVTRRVQPIGFSRECVLFNAGLVCNGSVCFLNGLAHVSR